MHRLCAGSILRKPWNQGSNSLEKRKIDIDRDLYSTLHLHVVAEVPKSAQLTELRHARRCMGSFCPELLKRLIHVAAIAC